jgi:hypothetical protein
MVMAIKAFLIPLVIVALVIYVILGPAVTQIVGEIAAELPLTQHAANSHIGEYNAVTISALMKSGACKPIQVWLCDKVKQWKAVCPLFPGIDLWAGLIVGTADPENPVVVTGYAARWAYWQGSFVRDSCVLAAP